MENKIGIGEWKMRNGLKAVVLGSQPGNNGQPWVGYSYDELGNTGAASWKDDGSWVSGFLIHHCDIISPWTSPIAPGHNPDKLTVEQVGDGWWLPEWEVLKDLQGRKKAKAYLDWFCDDKIWKSLVGDTGSCWMSRTYRTRLSLTELLALIAPKKRLIRVEELPALIHVTRRCVTYPRQLLVVGRDHESLIIDGRWFLISSLHKEGWEWSSDLKTWNSFEVEDKQ